MKSLVHRVVADIEKQSLYCATYSFLSVHDVARVRIAAYKRIIGELQDCISLDQCNLRTQRLANETYKQASETNPEIVQNGRNSRKG